MESLLPLKTEEYSDDFELESSLASPIKQFKNIEDDDLWTEEIPSDPITTSSNIFAFLESQRAVLEEKIGVATLLKVYKMIAKVERTVDDKLDYEDLIKVLGKGNEELIDDIIQLVVADQFFN